VARRAKGTPREAIRILKRARDVARLSAEATTDLAHVVQDGAPAIRLAHVVQAAERLGIDRHGLDRVEQAAVRLLVERGRPVGVEALAGRVGVDRETFRDVHEPWLERSGLIERTERGRVATGEALELYGAEAEGRTVRRAREPHAIRSRTGIPIPGLRLRR
jgi:Holliday junction DNA helicase RuvB